MQGKIFSRLWDMYVASRAATAVTHLKLRSGGILPGAFRRVIRRPRREMGHQGG